MSLIMDIIRKIFPPRLPPETLRTLEVEVQQTTHEANRVADAFADISQKAKDRDIDPIAMLVHEVKKASFHRQIRGQGNGVTGT